ncbi:MAG TPA: hypothetical protein VG796_12055 [Verrucomicrobiales bacterium]|nr:hypothetical protein [Verrucomicrobiales bacterium]
MKPEPPIDPAAAHRWFSVEYFNRVWTLLDQPTRTPEEEELMISQSHASLAHWRERPDCGQRELSIGWWQLSRVYAVVNQAVPATHYAQLSLEAATGQPPFFIGYAHEALARAAKMSGDTPGMIEHFEKAQSFAALVDDAQERQWLESDLASLRK